jgi:hypothetical protein
VNLPWDQEAAKALRVARAVLAPADMAWFEAAHAPAFPDPSAAMERTFGQLLGSDAEPVSSTEIEPEAIGPMPRREPHVGERAPAAGSAARPSSTPARRIARNPQARSSVTIRPHRPVARDDQSDPVHARDVDPAATDSPVTGRPAAKSGAVSGAKPDAVPGAWPDAAPGAWPEHVAKPGSPVPMERGTSWSDPSPLVEDRSNESRPARVAADPESFRDTARHDDDRQVIAHGGGAADLPHPRPAAARSTRLVSGLSELNNLFRSVIDNQADDRLAAETARPAAQIEHADAAPRPAARHEVIRPEAFPASRWTGPGADQAHETSFAAPSAHAERQVGLRADTPSVPSPIETPFASFAGAASVLPDPTREDVLLDRLLDRFEERLREQAIRHLGFTGGLT